MAKYEVLKQFKSLSHDSNDLEKSINNFDDIIENFSKSFLDTSNLIKKIITNKAGHKQTVWVKQEVKTPKYEKSGVRHVEHSGFKQGDKVEFIDSKGVTKQGEFKHVNVNKHSPNGYAVIRGDDGKLYERSLKAVKLQTKTNKQQINPKFSHLPEDVAVKIGEKLGEGHEGEIYDFGGDSVIKFFKFPPEHNPKWEAYEAMNDQGEDNFINVQKIDKKNNFVVLEKIPKQHFIDAKAIIEPLQKLKSYSNTNNMFQGLLEHKNKDKKWLSKEQKHFLEQLQEEIHPFVYHFVKDDFDYNSNNFAYDGKNFKIVDF